jgi:mono/diheme cytochrome c family protein
MIALGIILFLMAWLSRPSFGGNRACVNGVCPAPVQKVIKQYAAPVQQVVAVPQAANYFYSAGDQVLIEQVVQEKVDAEVIALVDEVSEELAVVLGEKLLKQQREWQQNYEASHSPPDPNNPRYTSHVQAKCIRCHGGDNPKAGLALDQPLTFEQAWKASRMVLRGEMPIDDKGNPVVLKVEERDALLLELHTDDDEVDAGELPAPPQEEVPPVPPQPSPDGGFSYILNKKGR